jgi:hypothetical protein
MRAAPMDVIATVGGEEALAHADGAYIRDLLRRFSVHL